MCLVNRDISFSRYPLRAESVQPARIFLTTRQHCSDAYGCSTKSGVLKEGLRGGIPLAHDDEQEHHERLFTLSEANRLIPQLNTTLTSIQQAKAVLSRTKEDIKKASAQAEYGGGSTVGHLYIAALQRVSANLQAIQELGILVKDLDLGLCDFPHLRDGRVVYLCWKLGEQEVLWWHETTTGYKDRCPLEGLA